jgi:hypothetical protein
MAEYKFIGPSAHFIDRHAGSGLVWTSAKGYKFPNGGTDDELRGMENIREIPDSFAPRFEKLYVDIETPLFMRVEEPVTATPAQNKGKGKKVKDADAVPAGNIYSGYSPDQIRGEYTNKTGKLPEASDTVAFMVGELLRVDAEAMMQTNSEVF